MKKSFFVVSLVILSVLLFTGCASKESTPRVPDENFVADINQFDLEEYHLLADYNLTSPKIQDFFISFSPRTNNIIVKVRLGIDVVSFSISYTDRMKIKEVVEQYLYDFENGNLKNVKTRKKNASFLSKSYVQWGVTGYGHETMAEYYTVVDFVEPTKPYLKLQFLSGSEEGIDHVGSPRFAVYLSPTQWKKIFETCNQEKLVAQSTQVVEEAYEF